MVISYMVKCASSHYYTVQFCCASAFTNTKWREKACLAALVWIWQQQWIDGRDYHKFVFRRAVLGIEEPKEEKRLLQSLVVRGFPASPWASIVLPVRRVGMGVLGEGRGRFLCWGKGPAHHEHGDNMRLDVPGIMSRSGVGSLNIIRFNKKMILEWHSVKFIPSPMDLQQITHKHKSQFTTHGG